MKPLFLFLFLFLLYPVPVCTYSPLSVSSDKISAAVAYLESHFNPDLNLLWESEDLGTHWLGFNYSYGQVYWTHSDNFFASLALEPFNPSMSAEIAHSLDSTHYVGYFSTLNGSIITEFRVVENIVLAQTQSYTILSRSYSGNRTEPGLDFADEAMYVSLSLYASGKALEARTLFTNIVNSFNGSCFLDASVYSPFAGIGAPSDVGFCANGKLALALFVGKVLKIPVPKEIETILWSMQLPNGGIASLSLEGKPVGSANVETTSLALLYLNNALILRLQHHQ